MWPLLIVGAAGLQVVRNATQRELTERLGPWGAAYVRFLYGLPFGLSWTAVIIAWRGYDGAPNLAFLAWVVLGGATQAAATALLVLAMRGRAFAVAMALQKTEVLGSAIVGALLIADVLTPMHWLGAVVGSAGVFLMARVSPTPSALRAAMFGISAGLLFSISSVSYRAASFAWGGDHWTAAAITLSSTLFLQTVIGGALLFGMNRPVFVEVLRSWRASLIPGATGAIASALLFTGFAIGPSAGAVKTVQLVDVIMSWFVSARLFRERITRAELIGGLLVLIGAAITAFG